MLSVDTPYKSDEVKGSLENTNLSSVFSIPVLKSA